ncbi:hypothetical protein A2U01_0052079, partial [Trifolium medium]|nr:hypothetical protein [Trifolium medium]
MRARERLCVEEIILVELVSLQKLQVGDRLPVLTFAKDEFIGNFVAGTISPFFIFPLDKGFGRGQRPRPFLLP